MEHCNKTFFKGWILKQLNIQNEGLFGSLDKIWNDIKDSKWLNGNSEGWERFPYFLNGFIPMAYLLKDEKLINKARYYVNQIISCQLENGNIIPSKTNDVDTNDIWPLFLILKVLTIYVKLSSDKNVDIVILKALNYIDNYLNNNSLVNWAKSRYFECYISMLYIKENYCDSNTQEFIKKLAIKLKKQGLDYNLCLPKWKKNHSHWDLDIHGVNISMYLKEKELYYALTGIQEKVNTKQVIDLLDKYHGTVYGHFVCDECLSNKTPYSGSELCSIVEAMYSFEVLFELTNDTYYLDRLEKLAFNALPAATLDNMWAHQYDQQANQIACIPFKGNIVFKTNKNEANIYGLEPNYGCCTANFGQGWPLFALTAYSYKNNKLQINIPLSFKIYLDDKTLLICDSDYPFKNTIKLFSNNDIIVKIRIPSLYTLEENIEIIDGFVTFMLKKNEEHIIKLNCKPLLNITNNNLFALSYGNLIFSLPISYKMEIKEYELNNVARKYPYCDYYFYPTSEFKFAFNSLNFKVIEHEYNEPFSRENPPLEIEGEFVKVDIRRKKGYQYVYQNKPRKYYDKKYLLRLKPYGATYLRMTELSFKN